MAIDGISSGVWTLSAGTFDSTWVGTSFVLAGSLSNNGTWTIATVLSPTTFTTVATPAPETFSSNVTMTVQVPGTIPALTDTLQPGALWIELFVAIAVLDKAEQDSTSLQTRLAAQTKRILDAMRYKQDEPKQVPLVRGRRGWPGGWRGGWY